MSESNLSERRIIAPMKGMNMFIVEATLRGEHLNVVLIGRGNHDRWIARGQHGRFGGLFVSREHAVKYALFKNDRRREAIIELATEVELAFDKMPKAERPASGARLSRRPGWMGVVDRTSGRLRGAPTLIQPSRRIRLRGFANSYLRP